MTALFQIIDHRNSATITIIPIRWTRSPAVLMTAGTILALVIPQLTGNVMHSVFNEMCEVKP